MTEIRNINMISSSLPLSRKPQVLNLVKGDGKTVNDSKKTHNLGIHNPWLYPFVAESLKPEILKMTGMANTTDSHLRGVIARKKADLSLRRVEKIKETAASGKTKKLGPGYDHLEKRATDAYKKQQNPELEKGEKIDTSSLLWYEVALGFLATFGLALYIGFDSIESILLALFGSALGIYFHEMHHFVTARRLILEKEFHNSLPHGLGLFHQELARAIKGEPSDSYIRVDIDKKGIRVIYPRQILSREENLKVDRSGSRVNVRFFVSFAILGILFHLAFTAISFPSCIQGIFSTFREGMRKK